jgi:hypothetical protein
MATSEGHTTGQTVIGVFTEREAAQQAVEALKVAGFGEERIACETGRLGLLDRLALPGHEAMYYETELQRGRTIVTVKAGERYQQADDILRQFGSYVYSGPYKGL